MKARQLEILDAPQLVTLHDDRDTSNDSPAERRKAPGHRYTTTAVIAEERSVMASAERLDVRSGFGLDPAARAQAAAAYTLTGEQAAALEHMTRDGGLAFVRGQAGTGKSQTMKAGRECYEQQGFKVVGLAWTNEVVNAMGHDGFTTTNTLSRELDLSGQRAARGGAAPADQWDSKTVVMVDEIAQLSTRSLAALLHKADERGAKLIGVGDDKQFAAIERGGMFTLLTRDPTAGGYGAAEITEVQRFKNADQQLQGAQRAAWKQMHEGDFLPALQTFEAQGCITWSNSQDGSKTRLAERYRADTLADPAKQRFIFAATNADVRDLNEMARRVQKEAGQLGEDRVLAATKNGPLEIATGDRIQMNTNGVNRAEKAAGIRNGAVGTVTVIESNEAGKPVVTLRFDAPKGKPQPEARFAVGEDRAAGEINQFSRGYAGTSYKGQGRSIDATYLFHSSQWQASASYVSATRHKETMALFASKESVTDAEPWMMETAGYNGLNGQHRASCDQSYAVWAELKPELAAKHDIHDYTLYVQEQWAKENKDKTDLHRLAESMGRDDMKRAASGYQIDAASAVRSGLAGAETFGRKEQAPAGPPSTPAVAASAGVAIERPSVKAQPAATPVPANDQSGQRGQVAAVRGTAPDIGAGVGAGAAKVLDAVAQAAEKAIHALADTLADLLGGGTSAPPMAPGAAPAVTAEAGPLDRQAGAEETLEQLDARLAEEERKALPALATRYGTANRGSSDLEYDDDRERDRQR